MEARENVAEKKVWERAQSVFSAGAGGGIVNVVVLGMLFALFSSFEGIIIHLVCGSI